MEAADRYWQIALIIDRVDQDTSFEGQHGCQENCYSADRLQRSQTWKMRRKAPIIVRFFKYPQQCHTGPWRPQDCCEPLCSSHTCSAGWVADVTKEPAPSRVEKNKQPNMRKHDTHAQAHNVEYYPRCCGRCCWLKECTFDLNLSSGCSCRKYGWGLTLGVSSCSFVQHEAAWSCMKLHENTWEHSLKIRNIAADLIFLALFEQVCCQRTCEVFQCSSGWAKNSAAAKNIGLLDE